MKRNFTTFLVLFLLLLTSKVLYLFFNVGEYRKERFSAQSCSSLICLKCTIDIEFAYEMKIFVIPFSLLHVSELLNVTEAFS